jgi:hypothetical protein
MRRLAAEVWDEATVQAPGPNAAHDHAEDRLGNIKEKAGTTDRWHDNRHTLVTELAKSGAGGQTIMDIAEHISKQMLAHYSHFRREAKCKVLEAIVKKPASAPAPQGQAQFTQEERPTKLQPIQ